MARVESITHWIVTHLGRGLGEPCSPETGREGGVFSGHAWDLPCLQQARSRWATMAAHRLVVMRPVLPMPTA